MRVGAESSIWTRVLSRSWADLSQEPAEGVLRLGFDKRDLKRIEKLGLRAQAGALTGAERAELEQYLQVSHVLMLMKAQARECCGSGCPARAARRARRAVAGRRD